MEGRQIQSTRLATPDISTAQNIELERDVPYSEFKFIAAIQGVLDRIPRRLVVAIMTFLTMSVYYMISTNFNNLLVAMVAKHNTTENKDYGKRFEWNDEQQVKTLCAFHIGQLITVVPAGILAEKVGCRYLVGLGISMAGLTNLILPVAAEVGIEMVNFCRVIQGFCCGTISPSMQFTFSRWAPPREKNIFLWTTLVQHDQFRERIFFETLLGVVLLAHISV
ncbi:sialin-like [Periplaneta americana]|uniref:sialin-like n=1 Tax=Periplaneta americana TaxID=6978 RepID=UPI0037E7912E